jgi:hypothetical protein
MFVAILYRSGKFFSCTGYGQRKPRSEPVSLDDIQLVHSPVPRAVHRFGAVLHRYAAVVHTPCG